MKDNFEECLFAIVPMPCCEGLGIPVGEVQILHESCIYSSTEDLGSIGAYAAGWIGRPVSVVVGGPLAYRAGKRLKNHKKTQDWHKAKYQKQKKPPEDSG